MRESVLAITLSIVLLVSHGAVAKGFDADWLSDRARLEALDDSEKCTRGWEILWDWSKRGNEEAQSLLLVTMMPPPDMAPLTLPGSSQDYVSKMRDLLIIAVHTEDALSASPYGKDYESTLGLLYSAGGFEGIPAGRRFLECRKEGTRDCSAIAVKEMLVPSFDDFAEQIDRLVTNGAKPDCGDPLAR